MTSAFDGFGPYTYNNTKKHKPKKMFRIRYGNEDIKILLDELEVDFSVTGEALAVAVGISIPGGME
jgi:hypothetical protein